MICFAVPTTITMHPRTKVVEFNGLNVTLSCEATGSGRIRYQWRRVNGEISSDRAEGVNTSTLTISPVQQEDENEYYCVASNGGVDGSLYNDTSSKAMVVVYGELYNNSIKWNWYMVCHTHAIYTIYLMFFLTVMHTYVLSCHLSVCYHNKSKGDFY